MQPARAPSRDTSATSVERVGLRARVAGPLREGAVGAAVAAQVGERDEDVARDADDRRRASAASPRRRPPRRPRGSARRRGAAGRAARRARDRAGRRRSRHARSTRPRGPRAEHRSTGDSSRSLENGAPPDLSRGRSAGTLLPRSGRLPQRARGSRHDVPDSAIQRRSVLKSVACDPVAGGRAGGAVFLDGAEEADQRGHHLLPGDARVEHRARRVPQREPPTRITWSFLP